MEDDGGDASISEVAKVKKSRKRGVLAELNDNAYEERYAEKETTDSILRRGLTVGHGRARNKRAMKAVKATRPVTLSFSPPAAADDNKRSFAPGEAAEKRVAIKLVFNHVFGSGAAIRGVGGARRRHRADLRTPFHSTRLSSPGERSAGGDSQGRRGRGGLRSERGLHSIKRWFAAVLERQYTISHHRTRVKLAGLELS